MILSPISLMMMFKSYHEQKHKTMSTEEKKEWIPVTLAVPSTNKLNESEVVLVCDLQNGSSGTAFYNSQNKTWELYHFSVPHTYIEVSHWMPMQKLPYVD